MYTLEGGNCCTKNATKFQGCSEMMQMRHEQNLKILKTFAKCERYVKKTRVDSVNLASPAQPDYDQHKVFMWLAVIRL